MLYPIELWVLPKRLRNLQMQPLIRKRYVERLVRVAGVRGEPCQLPHFATVW